MDSLLLCESTDFLLTEDSYFILIEPVSSTFGNRFAGIAVIKDMGSFWEMDLGKGPVRAQYAQQLVTEALNSGASGIAYE